MGLPSIPRCVVNRLGADFTCLLDGHFLVGPSLGKLLTHNFAPRIDTEISLGFICAILNYRFRRRIKNYFLQFLRNSGMSSHVLTPLTPSHWHASISNLRRKKTCLENPTYLDCVTHFRVKSTRPWIGWLPSPPSRSDARFMPWSAF